MRAKNSNFRPGTKDRHFEPEAVFSHEAKPREWKKDKGLMPSWGKGTDKTFFFSGLEGSLSSWYRFFHDDFLIFSLWPCLFKILKWTKWGEVRKWSEIHCSDISPFCWVFLMSLASKFWNKISIKTRAFLCSVVKLKMSKFHLLWLKISNRVLSVFWKSGEKKKRPPNQRFNLFWIIYPNFVRFSR